MIVEGDDQHIKFQLCWLHKEEFEGRVHSGLRLQMRLLGAEEQLLQCFQVDQIKFQTLKLSILVGKLLTLPRLIDNSFWKRQNYVHFNSFAVLATQARNAIWRS